LDWIWELNHIEGRTIGFVLHDLGMACRYADKIIFMKEGKIVAAGSPEEIVTADLVQKVYQVNARIISDPLTGKPLVVPANVLK
jgi:iron complex transport system ATP-binding protein